MRRTTRLIAGTVATFALIAGLTATGLTTASATITSSTDPIPEPIQPPSVPTAYPGMLIDFDGDVVEPVGKMCTLGVVGTDAAGRKVGITAGHCNPQKIRPIVHEGVTYPHLPKYLGAERGVPVTDNNHPVYDLNAVAWADKHNLPPVAELGWIRWVDPVVCADNEIAMDGLLCNPDDRSTAMNSTTDYMVIEFAPETVLSNKLLDQKGNPAVSRMDGRQLKVDSILTDANGAPKLPNILSYVENWGGRSTQHPDPVANGVAPGYGMVTGYPQPGMIRAAAGHQGGDSGGPVFLAGTGKWVGIITKHTGGIVPWVNTSAKNILDDLAKRPGGVGFGFTPTSN